MNSLVRALRERLLPAALTAAGVTLIAAGLLSYSGTAVANPGESDPPLMVSAEPSPSLFVPSFPPITVGPTASPTPPPANRVATRIVIRQMRIDLPVIYQKTDYVPCGVAMYLLDPGGRLSQPGFGRATYIYSHAQKGMFLPLLNASKINNGKAMLGMIVEVYTSDDWLFTYEVTQVRRHVKVETGLDAAYAATSEQLWLQTSEGVGVHWPKLQLLAKPVVDQPATHAAAHPTPKPRRCG